MIAKVLGGEVYSNVDETSPKSGMRAKAKLTVYDKKIKVDIIGEGFEVRISKLTGDITSIQYNNSEYLVEPIRVVFDANEVVENPDADRDSTILSAIREVYKRDQKPKVKEVIIDNNGDESLIMVVRKVKNVKEGLITQYIIDMYGNITVTNVLTPKRDIYRFGMTMTVAKGNDYIAWASEVGKSGKSDERCKLITSDTIEPINKGSKLKYKIRARKNNIKTFKLTDEFGLGVQIDSVNNFPLSVRAKLYTFSMGCEDQYKEFRLKDSIIVNIDYREKQDVSSVYGENYEEEYKLKKNIQYTSSFKITSAL